MSEDVVGDVIARLEALRRRVDRLESQSALNDGEYTVAPNTVSHTGNLTTSATTELTLITQTLTAPPVAGQIHITAFTTVALGTAAGDLFAVRLYVGGVQKAVQGVTTIAGAYTPVALSCVAAVTAAAGQIVKLTIQRISGTGTITSIDGWNGMSWVVLPGAGTTA